MSWKLKAVVLDWAGTMIDHGSLAPMGSFVEAFSRFGVDLTVDEARQPMGMAKRAHVAALLALPRVSAAWEAAHGHAPAEADIDAVYEVFVPMNLEVAARYADLVPGAADVVRRLRELGLKIGSSTGYTHDIMNRILLVAAAQGYEPDCLICAGETAEGRPTPLMMYRCFLELGVASLVLREGGRHRGRHSRGTERWSMDRRRSPDRQSMRPVARRTRGAEAARAGETPSGSDGAAARGRRALRHRRRE
jgi:phosphonoacetaldehyde hydrolase